MASLARLNMLVRAVPRAARCVPTPSALRCHRVLPAPGARAWLHCSSLLWATDPSPAAAANAAPEEPVKYTTHIAGLDVVPNGREVLMGLLKEILDSIQAYNKELGFEPMYNKNVRISTAHRLKICEQEQTHAGIEKRIWFGQIEELIEQAEDELDLLVAMNEEVKPWEPDPVFRAECKAMMSPDFGETWEEMEAAEQRAPGSEVASAAEKAAEEAFWKDIDAEIAEDQRKERAARGEPEPAAATNATTPAQ